MTIQIPKTHGRRRSSRRQAHKLAPQCGLPNRYARTMDMTAPNGSPLPHPDGAVGEVHATEIDDFNLGLPKMSASLRRSDAGVEHTRLRIRGYEGMIVGHIDMGFSKVGHVDTDADVVTIVAARTSPPGTKWDGIDVDPGDAALYPGGGHHQAVDMAGLDAAFVVIDEEALLKAVDDLGRRPIALRQGRLSGAQGLAFLRAHSRYAFTDEVSGILEEVARFVSSEPAVASVPSSRRLSSERIVRAAVAYATEAGEWMPSSLALCRASGVSERRLQTAFHDIYDCPPSRYFRMRALSEARSRLVGTMGDPSPVTTVALELGFRHLGRFSSLFRAQFGDYPSDLVRKLSKQAGSTATAPVRSS